MHEGLPAAGFVKQTECVKLSQERQGYTNMYKKHRLLRFVQLPSARKSNKEERETEFFSSLWIFHLRFVSLIPFCSPLCFWHCPPFPPSSSCDAAFCVPPLLCHWPMANCVGSVRLMTWLHTNIAQLSMPTSSTDANWCRPAPTVHKG